MNSDNIGKMGGNVIGQNPNPYLQGAAKHGKPKAVYREQQKILISEQRKARSLLFLGDLEVGISPYWLMAMWLLADLMERSDKRCSTTGFQKT